MKVELVEKDDSIKFNLRSEQKIVNLMGLYQYKFDYAGTPVFKPSGGKERYLYWSPRQYEWMVTCRRYFSLLIKVLFSNIDLLEIYLGQFNLQIGGGVLSKLPFLRSSCTEKYPQNCKDKWGAQYNTFKLNLTCGNTLILFLQMNIKLAFRCNT